jgi:hypothetical protein
MALLSSKIEDKIMQVFANVATAPERKESRTTKKGYYQFRVCESQRGSDQDPTWYTCRVMRDEDPCLEKGDFVKVTGKLKADFYIGRDGKPTGALLIIAFEASKIAKPAVSSEEAPSVRSTKAPKEEPKALPNIVESTSGASSQRALDTKSSTPMETEPDWSTMYA